MKWISLVIITLIITVGASKSIGDMKVKAGLEECRYGNFMPIWVKSCKEYPETKARLK